MHSKTEQNIKKLKWQSQ